MNKLELYCPHCDDWHKDNELNIDVEWDYVECKTTNKEIKTYKFIDSEKVKRWRKCHKLEVIDFLV